MIGKNSREKDSIAPSADSEPVDSTTLSSARSNATSTGDSNALSSQNEVDAFLDAVKQSPAVTTGSGRGRLVFALDATASRQRTWDQAMALQSDMFVHTRGIGALDVQLVYYRGFDECRASKWLNNADKVIALMRKVSCQAGRTQIRRVLEHALAEGRRKPVQALVFIGDCVEEDIDKLGNLAGQARLLDLPVFIFQEGHDPQASFAFAQIAKLSGGAHCRFDAASARQLGDLLNAVAAYAAGGRKALQQLEKQGSRQAATLLEQLD